MKHDPKIIVAMDMPDFTQAVEMARRLNPAFCRLKVGKELFTAAGPQVVDALMTLGFEVFLDLKYHDIPNTVAQACKVAASMGVWMVNMHALGGRKMLEAAREAVANVSNPPKLIAVTVLTSMSESDLKEVGIGNGMIPLIDEVTRLAKLAKDCGLDGVVSSAKEAKHLRFQLGDDFCLVTPGIRPADASADDQARIATPSGAIEAGSNYLVIGRPITKAPVPREALLTIHRQICSAQAGLNKEKEAV